MDLMNTLVPVLAQADSSAGFSITSLLGNFGTSLNKWGSLIIFIFGVAAIISAVYMLVTGLISHGKKQTSWAVVIILFIVGGVCTAGGASGAWKFVAGSISGGDKETVAQMGANKSEGDLNLSTGLGAVTFDTAANVLYLG